MADNKEKQNSESRMNGVQRHKPKQDVKQRGKYLLGAGKSVGEIAGEDTPQDSEHKRTIEVEDVSPRKKLQKLGEGEVKVKSKRR